MNIKTEAYISYELIDGHLKPKAQHWTIYDQQSFNITLFTETTAIDVTAKTDCVVPIIPSNLSPVQYNITLAIAEQIERILNSGQDVTLSYNTISITSNIKWHTKNSLTIKAKEHIILGHAVVISNAGAGTLNLVAGIEGNASATVKFSDTTTISMLNGGKAKIFYNPSQGQRAHKYHNPTDFDNLFSEHSNYEAFMFVNSAKDFQDIRLFRSGNYALSRNIDGQFLKLTPVGTFGKPFSGIFDGNNFQISNLNINAAEFVGLFGFIEGSEEKAACISNLKISNIHVLGNQYIGLLVGAAKYTHIDQIIFDQNNVVSAKQIAGSLVGSGDSLEISNINFIYPTNFTNDANYQGELAGALTESVVKHVSCIPKECIGFSEDNTVEI